MKATTHKPGGQMSEAFLTAIFVVLSGGLQDAYTYLCRGKVFANAQTGNIVLCSAYLFDGEYIPLRTLPGMEARTITLNSFSKNYLMTGWRVGAIIAEPELLAVMNRVNGSLIYSAPSISQRAAIAALHERARIREAYVTAYRDRIFYSAERLSKIPYLSLVAPKGTFYLFPGVEKTGLSSKEFCKALLERAHILVSPGDVFGTAGAQHFRIACTVDIEKLRAAYDRMEALQF